MGEKEIEVAIVTDFFAHVGVVALKVTNDGIRIGDVLHFQGHTTDTIVEVSSMQIEHEDVKEAKVGDDIGIKVNERIRTHDKVFKVISEE